MTRVIKALKWRAGRIDRDRASGLANKELHPTSALPEELWQVVRLTIGLHSAEPVDFHVQAREVEHLCLMLCMEPPSQELW